MTDMTCRKSMQRCQTPGMCAPHGGCSAPVQASPIEQQEPAELLAMRMVSAWADSHGRPVPWIKAVEIIAIFTNMPAEEKAALIALDDTSPANQYPINHGTHIIQFGDETFVWYDEAGLQGGVTYTLESAESALLRYVERLNRPAPAPDGRPAGCCCPPPGHTGIWAGAMCPVHHGLRRQVL